MGRNDMCFCMSGKKDKACHPDIHEESLAADKLKVYGQLEQDLKIHGQETNGNSLCVPGCTDCCFDYFTIQIIEFDLIINELKKWDEEKLNALINKVDKYWMSLENDYPEVKKLLQKSTAADIERINNSIDKTSLPCIFLDETTKLCQIYNSRLFKCRVFGNTYYYPQSGEGALALACHRYEGILNEDNFDVLLCDATDILNQNTDLSIIQDKKRNIAFTNPEYPLIYHLYQHFIVKKLGVSIADYNKKFTMTRSAYYNY